ncbi:hypothetical protein SAMN05421504_10665 [Amycolatopsis xylanica]|uniref:DUF3592 domain-containing protein n=1 Tax=Amycolatopsis xylanica TaxID=589385 RepID=A0A1H3L6H0_9PSEU|nr:DUF3592 domain-containing protein [Amycolatopsis xylanica]SDY59475.1 hypothetical protein SAMN05421504_10665 [Amycolatopsis xylanica]
MKLGERAVRPRRRPSEEPQAIDGQTRRLRTISRRAYGLAVVCAGMVIGGCIGLVAMNSAAETLLANGTRVPGMVVTTHNPVRGTPSMVVEYITGGRRHRAEIQRDSGRDYVPFEQVTVVYDPAESGRVRTLDEANDTGSRVVLGMALLVALVCVPFYLAGGAAWRRRHRAVLETGWREASVTVVPDYPVRRNRNSPDLYVSYEDGSTARLRGVPSLRGATRMRHEPGTPAWVGGTGENMVVVFERGRWLRAPYIVPVRVRPLAKYAFLG